MTKRVRLDTGSLALAMPFALSSISVGVNKDMFDKAGIPPPKYDWKWDEMLDVTKTLTKPGVQ